MSGMQELRDGFFEECDDLLEALSDGLNALEDGSGDDETINAVFRAVHSIKGGAGAFSLENLVDFAHCFENVLDELRSNQLNMNADLLQLFFLCSDHLSALVEAARADIEPDLTKGHDLTLRLTDISGTVAPAQHDPDETSLADSFAPLGLSLDLPTTAPANDIFTITFKPFPELYTSGNDPVALLRNLAELGGLTATADSKAVPALAQFQDAGLAWTLTLDSAHNQDDIEAVFEFVEGLCHLEISASMPPPLPDLGPDLSTMITPDGPTDATTTPPVPPAGQTAMAKPTTKPSPAKKAGNAAKTTIRVDLERVDRLINIVGELVISEAMLSQSIKDMSLSSDSQVGSAMAQLKQLSSELQESVMAIRAQPVKSLFQRMSRIVREAAHATGKQAKLVTEGDSTEIDKTVIERLVDPLTHMIRNAVDHGLEDGDQRKLTDKPDQGCVTLSAAHRSGRVIIELSDDGAGIDRPKVRQIAEVKGLIAPDADLTDSEIDNILFMPGFSTTESVSNLSGRGVGMDVVKNEILSLGGRVSIASRAGEGTTVSISLPLTLAVLEGMIVQTAGETVVVPTTALRETIRATPDNVRQIGPSDHVLSARDMLVPVVDLGASLGFRQNPPSFVGSTLLLVEADSGQRTAVAVDKVFDQREVVIKGLEKNYGNIPGIAAATILGDGRIALIIDTDQVSARPQEQDNQTLSAPTTGAQSHAATC